MQNEVTFTDWIIEESKLRNEFFSWWSKCNKEYPATYRDKLEPQEWKREFEWWLLYRGRE